MEKSNYSLSILFRLFLIALAIYHHALKIAPAGYKITGLSLLPIYGYMGSRRVDFIRPLTKLGLYPICLAKTVILSP